MQQNNIVHHQSNQHDHHFQLMIYPEENRTGNQAQNAAVDEVLEDENQIKTGFGGTQRASNYRLVRFETLKHMSVL